MADLVKAAHALLATGPHKHEPSSRRIRVLLNNVYIFDTTSTLLVWEHPYFPQYYLPLSALQNATIGVGEPVPEPPPSASQGRSDTSPDNYTLHALDVNGQRFSEPCLLSVHAGPLAGHVRLSFPKMQGWFEEDEPIRGHPTDLYKRIDVRRSSRPIRVEVGGVEVASAPWSVHLFETGLPTRYYLPRLSVKWDMLQESGSRTYCPYKGWANYYDVRTDGKVEQDIVWWYESPLLEVTAIRDCVSFYNEKVDVWLDGKKLERPKSHFV